MAAGPTPHQLLALVLLAQAAGGPPGRRRRLGTVTGAVTGVVGNRVLEELDLDAAVRQVDVDALLARVDADALLDRVDVDRLLDRVDVDRLLERVEVNALLDRVDVDRLLERVEVNALLDRVDVDRLLERVEVNALLDRVEVDRLLERADVDALLDRVDVDRLVNRVDLDRLLGTVNIELLVRRAGIPELVAESTGQVAGSALDLGRRQLVGIDVGITRVVQRLLRRDPAALPPGPARFTPDPTDEVVPPDPTASRVRARMEVTGYYAGPVSRAVAFAGDVALATVSFTFSAAVLSWLLTTVVGVGFDTTERTGPWWAAGFVLWFFGYWWLSTTLAGRTPAKLIAGLHMLARDGTPLTARRSLVRTLALPVSFSLAAFSAISVLVDPERRSLHDRIAGSVVVYDWGGRPAELPSPLTRWIADHGGGS